MSVYVQYKIQNIKLSNHEVRHPRCVLWNG